MGSGRIRTHCVHQSVASKAFGGGVPIWALFAQKREAAFNGKTQARINILMESGRIRAHCVHQSVASKAFGGGVPILVVNRTLVGGGDVY